jgi:hypothetical protein
VKFLSRTVMDILWRTAKAISAATMLTGARGGMKCDFES